MLRQYFTDEKGATALVFSLAAPVLIGGVIMAVEVGHWHQKQSSLQTIADNAAIAAAREIKTLKEKANVKTTAEGDAFENGFDFSLGTVTAYSPPVSGDFVGKDGVQIMVEQNQPLYFGKYFIDRQITHKVSATALIIDGIPACVLSLSPDASPGIKISGSANVDITGCSAHSNSYATGAMEMGGSASFTADCASAIGTILGEEQMNLTACSGAQANSLPMDDPYADLTVPANVAAMPCQKLQKTGKKSIHLPSGRYCKTVSYNNAITLDDGGTYIFDASDLTLQSNAASLTGTNVTLIFMNGGLFRNVNGGLINLTAKTSGDYAGVLMYVDRDTTPVGTNLTFNGNQNSTMEGVLYFPTVDLKIDGASTTTSECTHVIGYTVEFTGNAKLANTNCEGVGTTEIGGVSGIALFE